MDEMTDPPVALTIAGSDSIGGAGIQADLKTFAVFGCHGASALTAITAQSTTGVRAATGVDPALLAEQIDAVADDTTIAATKTGMIGSAAATEVVARAVSRHRLAPLVVDPVMVAKSGDALIDHEAIEALSELLLPLATVLTPNRYEAARLLAPDADAGELEPPATVDAAADAARAICERFDVPVCVVTGLRRGARATGLDADTAVAGPDEAVDVCCHGRTVDELASPWQPGRAVHGSGCAYSAAITAALAHGEELDDALRSAKRFITAAIGAWAHVGRGAAQPVNPMAWRDAPGAVAVDRCDEPNAAKS